MTRRLARGQATIHAPSRPTAQRAGPKTELPGLPACLSVPGAVFRATAEPDTGRTFEHRVEPVGAWLVEHEGAVVATGGIAAHDNPPYCGLFMELDGPSRRRGFVSHLVRELKRACYAMGRVPAARCDATNAASRATLRKAGLFACARMLNGAPAIS